MKKIFMFVICFLTVLTTTLGLTGRHYNVFASTGFNIFDIALTQITTQNANYTRTETGFIIETVSIGSTSSYISCWYKLLPNTQFVLRWEAEKLISNSSNLVYAWGSRDQYLNGVRDGNEITFTTDETGTGRFLFYSKDGTPDTIYKTEYSNIYLAFVDEALGAVYERGYKDGRSSQRLWLPYTEYGSYDYFTADISDLYEYLPRINGIKPFGSTILGLGPGTYRITFVNKTSGFYPLMYDFGGVVHNNFSFNVITPIYKWDLTDFPFSSVYRLDVYNLSGYSYSFEDALSCESIVFTIPPSAIPKGEDYAMFYFYMMRLDDTYNFVHWDINIRPKASDIYSIDILEPIGDYNMGYEDGYERGLSEGHNSGYNQGYNSGYQAGYNAGLSGTITPNWFTSFLNSVFDILNIEIFPNVRLIYLIFIPIGLGVLALIFKLIRG